jgi:SAM-dependent methyltransferase
MNLNLNLIKEENRGIVLIDSILDNESGFKIDLGCGKNKREFYYGIDIEDLEGVDLVSDIDVSGINLLDNSVCAVRAIHFLEHCSNPIFVINEIMRVCKNRAFVYIVVPHPASLYFFQDPTHKSFFTEKTFQNYFSSDYLDSYTKRWIKNGDFINELLFLYGKDFMHLSIHILYRVVKDE